MRVALLTRDWPAFEGGGVSALAELLARSLQAAGVGVEVWTRGGGKRSRALERRPSEVPVHGFPGRSWRARGRRHWARGIAKALPRFAPDAVIASTWEPAVGLLDVLPGLHVFAHGRDITGELDARRSAARAEVLRSDVHWLCLTRWMERELEARGVDAARIHRVPAAVEPAPCIERAADQVPVALCVGRLVPRKGQDVAIQAVERLAGSIRLRLVGEGPDRARLERLAGPHVTIEGWLPPDELEKAWAEADLFVMPARTEVGGDTEGYGLVFLEAAARGLPSVGARSAGAAEAVEHEVTGLLVEDPTSSAAVAQALARLVSDPELRRALGREGRRRHQSGGRPEHLARAVLEVLA